MFIIVLGIIIAINRVEGMPAECTEIQTSIPGLQKIPNNLKLSQSNEMYDPVNFFNLLIPILNNTPLQKVNSDESLSNRFVQEAVPEGTFLYSNNEDKLSQNNNYILTMLECFDLNLLVYSRRIGSDENDIKSTKFDHLPNNEIDILINYKCGPTDKISSETSEYSARKAQPQSSNPNQHKSSKEVIKNENNISQELYDTDKYLFQEPKNHEANNDNIQHLSNQNEGNQIETAMSSTIIPILFDEENIDVKIPDISWDTKIFGSDTASVNRFHKIKKSNKSTSELPSLFDDLTMQEKEINIQSTTRYNEDNIKEIKSDLIPDNESLYNNHDSKNIFFITSPLHFDGKIENITVIDPEYDQNNNKASRKFITSDKINPNRKFDPKDSIMDNLLTTTDAIYYTSNIMVKNPTEPNKKMQFYSQETNNFALQHAESSNGDIYNGNIDDITTPLNLDSQLSYKLNNNNDKTFINRKEDNEIGDVTDTLTNHYPENITIVTASPAAADRSLNEHTDQVPIERVTNIYDSPKIKDTFSKTSNDLGNSIDKSTVSTHISDSVLNHDAKEPKEQLISDNKNKVEDQDSISTNYEYKGTSKIALIPSSLQSTQARDNLVTDDVSQSNPTTHNIIIKTEENAISSDSPLKLIYKLKNVYVTQKNSDPIYRINQGLLKKSRLSYDEKLRDQILSVESDIFNINGNASNEIQSKKDNFSTFRKNMDTNMIPSTTGDPVLFGVKYNDSKSIDIDSAEEKSNISMNFIDNKNNTSDKKINNERTESISPKLTSDGRRNLNNYYINNFYKPSKDDTLYDSFDDNGISNKINVTNVIEPTVQKQFNVFRANSMPPLVFNLEEGKNLVNNREHLNKSPILSSSKVNAALSVDHAIVVSNDDSENDLVLDTNISGTSTIPKSKVQKHSTYDNQGIKSSSDIIPRWLHRNSDEKVVTTKRKPGNPEDDLFSQIQDHKKKLESVHKVPNRNNVIELTIPTQNISKPDALSHILLKKGYSTAPSTPRKLENVPFYVNLEQSENQATDAGNNDPEIRMNYRMVPSITTFFTDNSEEITTVNSDFADTNRYTKAVVKNNNTLNLPLSLYDQLKMDGNPSIEADEFQITNIPQLQTNKTTREQYVQSEIKIPKIISRDFLNDSVITNIDGIENLTLYFSDFTLPNESSVEHVLGMLNSSEETVNENATSPSKSLQADAVTGRLIFIYDDDTKIPGRFVQNPKVEIQIAIDGQSILCKKLLPKNEKQSLIISKLCSYLNCVSTNQTSVNTPK